MWQFLPNNCREKFIPADVMLCGNITSQPLNGKEGDRVCLGKVVIKSDCSRVDKGGQTRRMDETGFNCQEYFGNPAGDK